MRGETRPHGLLWDGTADLGFLSAVSEGLPIDLKDEGIREDPHERISGEEEKLVQL